MQKRRILAGFLVSTCSFASTMVPYASAQSPSVEEALGLKPIQRAVDYEKVTSADTSKLTLEPITDKGRSGWVLKGSDGRVLRRFVDTNSDGATDLWCYFQAGVEVYRDVDSDFDKRADQYRWLGTAGTRVGLDIDQDGKLDSWTTISAQETTSELIAAIASGDAARFERLLISEQEMEDLGLGDEITQRLTAKRRKAVRDFPRFAKDQTAIGKGGRWIHFAANMPGTVPAGEAGVEKDVVVYENAIAMFESDNVNGQLVVGTMVRAGDAWRLVDLPQISGTDLAIADSSGFFFSGGAMALSDAATGGISGDLQKLVGDLEKIDLAIQKATGSAAAKLHDQRADVMERIIAASEDDQKDAWIRQLVDTVGAAIESGDYPDGIPRLERISQQLVRNLPELRSYVDFQVINSDYAQRVSTMSTQKEFAEVQEWRLKSLESFVDKHPDTIEEARAMLKIGLAKELEDDEKSAVAWYTKVAAKYRATDEGRKAAGAVRRLESVGRVIPLEGKTLDNREFDLSKLRGKPVVVHYWATWCEPCKQDMKLLRDLQARYQKAGLQIVGVNVDGLRSDAVQYANENRIPWVTLYAEGGLDASPLANALGVQTLPTMLLIDASGKVVENNVPASQLNEAIDLMLRAKK
jgi:thiol-disulfide isomerase/thioredoxin